MPKKRGPKTDVLEALLKRVDGLEAKLREKNEEGASPPAQIGSDGDTADTRSQHVETGEPAPKRIAIDTRTSPSSADMAVFSPCTPITRFETRMPSLNLIADKSTESWSRLQSKWTPFSTPTLPVSMASHTTSSMNPPLGKDFS